MLYISVTKLCFMKHCKSPPEMLTAVSDTALSLATRHLACCFHGILLPFSFLDPGLFYRKGANYNHTAPDASSTCGTDEDGLITCMLSD